jgi:hypothetical protein
MWNIERWSIVSAVGRALAAGAQVAKVWEKAMTGPTSVAEPPGDGIRVLEQPKPDALLPDGLPDWASEPPLSVVTQPFQTWNALAVKISQGDPELADIISQSASLLIAELEINSPKLKEAVFNALSGSLQDLVSDSALREAIDEVFPNVATDSPEAIAASLDHAYRSLQGRVGEIETSEAMTSEIVKSFVDHQPVGSQLDYDHLNDYLKRRLAGDFKLRTIASLEPPEVLGHNQTPIYCVKQGRWIRKFAMGQDRTYQGDVRTTFRSPKTNAGYIPRSCFELNISEDVPSTHFRLVTDASLNSLYAVNMIYGINSRRVEKIADVLEARKEGIRSGVEIVTGAAVTASQHVVAAHGVPPFILEPLAKALKLLVAAIAEGLRVALVKSIGDTELATWLLWNTVLAPNNKLPLSIFVISAAGKRAPRLQTVQKTQGGQLVLVEKYVDPDVDTHAQFMYGFSEKKQDLCMTEYWNLTAKAGMPVALTQPLQDQSGFHVLVPHYDKKFKSGYVSAIRADLRST